MNEWRSEPPDSPGWWLWRAQASTPTMTVGVVRVLVSRDIHHRLVRSPLDALPLCPRPMDGGQWLKVPE